MDRVTKLRGQAGGSKDSTLDDSSPPSEAYTTANESSKYFSLSEDDSTFDISPIKDVSLASAADPEKAITENDELISNLSPISKKNEMLDYKIGKQIEAANILSGGVDIFEDNNSYDGNELVIDDNVDIDEKTSGDLKLNDNDGLEFQKAEDISDATLVENDNTASKDTEVVLQIDGKNVNAIDIGNGLYLYRKDGQEELAAVQIIDDDQNQPSFKFLKVRENAEGNLEVYEEIEVPKEVPPHEGKTAAKKASQVPLKDAKIITSSTSSSPETKTKNNACAETKVLETNSEKEQLNDANKDQQIDLKLELNVNGETFKINEKRKSPVIHSTPNKEGIPLTKTMVDLHLHPNRHLDNVKTIEVHTDSKHKQIESPTKTKDLDEDKISQPVIEKTDLSVNPTDDDIEEKTKESLESEKEVVVTKIATENESSKQIEDVLPDEKIQEQLIATSVKEIQKETITTDKPAESLPSKTSENVSVIGVENIESVQNVEPIESLTTKANEIVSDTKDIEKESIKKDISRDSNISAGNSMDVPLQERITSDSCVETIDTNKQVKPINNELDSKAMNSVENKVECKVPKPLITEKQKTEAKIADFFNKLNKPETSEDVKEEKLSVSKSENPVQSKPVLIEDDSNIKETPAQILCGSKSGLTNDQNSKIETEIIKDNFFKQSETPAQNLFESKSDLISEQNTKIETEIIKDNCIKQKEKPAPILFGPKSNLINEENSKIETEIFKDNCIKQASRKEDLKSIVAESISNKTTNNINSEIITTIEPNILNTDSTVAKHFTLPAQVQHITEIKKDNSKVSAKIETKSLNNNHAAVPFGKWTEANRQEFLNKIKESKIPTNTSNSKQIKQPNDLNRRDVLQKIDSQRQTNNAIALAKIQENKNPQMNVKVEAKSFAIKSVPVSAESKHPVKTESIIKTSSITVNKKTAKQETEPNYSLLKDMPNTVFSSTTVTKKETAPRKEINNQELIDKTIEGIITKAILVKSDKEIQNDLARAFTKTQESTTYSISQQSKDMKPPFQTSLDAIEMKMNELHGIPFVERPPHELPHRFNKDIKTYSAHDNSKINKTSKIPTSLPSNNHKTANDIILELDSEEEIIEFEPITGDVTLNKSNTEAKTAAQPVSLTALQVSTSKKSPIITENEFDKFVRRNSITYENCLTVNFDSKQPRNVVQAVVEKDVPVKKYSRNELLLAEAKVKSTNKQQQILRQNQHTSKIQISSKLVPVNNDALNKNYHSKLQMAYQSALTAKRQKESPITIIEDKPVKVVFMDSNHEFMPKKLNAQGNQLSPTKKSLPEPEAINDSLDSDILDITDETKFQDDSKCKTKHQRKQVLTPVETPELELIEPKDLTLNDEGSPKKKRKLEENKSEKSPKHLLPKKTYLLNRAVPDDNIPVQPTAGQISPKENMSPQPQASTSHSNAASAIDNLVKAAELLENQSEVLDASVPSTSSATPQTTPAKRGRGRPRKYPLPDGTPDKGKTPSPQKKPRLGTKKPTPSKDSSDSDSDDDNSSAEEGIARENWTMGKINENIVCPICNKLFRSENVVFKHVKHCSGPSPNRLGSGKRGRRKSRRSGEARKSRECKSDDAKDEGKRKSKKGGTPKKSKSNDSNDATTSSENQKDEVIVIEDSPAQEKPTKQAPRRPGRPRIYPKNAIFECEICGKQFRQMSYLVNHKLQHKKNEAKKDNTKATENDSIFSCEVCKKEFRKLHHLVQHRLIHSSNDGPSKPARKSSSEQSVSDKSKDQEVSKQDDQNAAFRCEPCDKSFRKLHHLVEHRETHDGINRQKIPTTPPSEDKPVTSEPPQCDICNKTFRKLHHLIDHKEQHNDAHSDKSDDKSVKSSLSTKDIIHECSLCYMVFPNEHSLNKHTVFCQKKKKQAVVKQTKVTDLDENKEETIEKSANNKELEHSDTIVIEEDAPKVESEKLEEKVIDEPALESSMKISEILQKRLLKAKETTPVEHTKPVETVVEQKVSTTKRENVSAVITEPQTPAKVPKLEEKAKDRVPPEETPKTTVLPKEKVAPIVTRRRKSSNGPLPVSDENVPSIASSDDDEVRYMLNPEYKIEKDNESTFMEVRANKRNSLQVERPNSKDLTKRRTSLQPPSKVPRLKPKLIEVRAQTNTVKPKLESISSVDSDDSDVKYSFPTNAKENLKEEKKLETPKIVKEKKKPLIEKRKTLTGIAKRKSLGKTAAQTSKPSPARQIKRRTAEAEHRCDCGALFLSAALLARHTSLAHTPPRIRRRRSPPPSPKPKPRKSIPKTADSRKSSTTDKPKAADSQKPPTTDKPKPDSRKSSTTDKHKTGVTRKSSTNVKTKTPLSRKSSANDKPKPTPRKSSVNDKAKVAVARKSSTNENPKAANSRKSSVNDKPKATDSRKSSVNSNTKVPAKSDNNSEAKTPKRKSVRGETTATSSLKRTSTKVRRDTAHRGVPVPEKLKKMFEKNKK